MTAHREATTFTPSDEQRVAIDAPEHPVRIIAGAGSGKTTVMALRIARFIERGRRPDEILALTFSNKAAENLRLKVAKLVRVGIDVRVSTYHGFGASLVNEHAELLGFTERPTLIDRATAFQLLYESLHEVELDRRKTGRIASLAAAALRLGSQCGDHLVGIDALIADCDRLEGDAAYSDKARDVAVARRDLARMLEVYERVKRTRDLIDFGDQIALAVRLMTSHRDVAATIRSRHPVVLLDEYQDTNFAQRRLLQLVYPPGSPVTVVGDDLQSIYGFRGAHLRNLFDFEQHFADGSQDRGLTEVALTVNYRSGPSVVSLANVVHASVTQAIEKELRPRTDAHASHVDTVVFADELAEAQHVAAWIQSVGNYEDTVVLARKRKLFPLLADVLTDAGIPVEVIGVGGLLSRPEVTDVIAWLEILALDDANVAVLRLLRSPLRRIGLRDLAALGAHARNLARRREPDVRHPPTRLLDAIADLDAVAALSAEAWARIKSFAAEHDQLGRAARFRPIVDVIGAIADTECFRDRLDARADENLLRLIEVARQYESTHLAASGAQATPRGFLEYLQLIRDSEDEPAEADSGTNDAVRIMTIHQAKGLEFENVALVGLAGRSKTSSIFPDERIAENGVTQSEVLPLWLREDHDGFVDAPRTTVDERAAKDRADRMRADEERRLLYVAITRAKSRLLCTAAQWYSGPSAPQGPSVFLHMIEETSTQGLVGVRPHEAPADINPAVAQRQRLAAAQQREQRLILDASQAAQAESGTSPGRRTRRRVRVDGQQTSLLVNRPPAARSMTTTPGTISVSELVLYERCPKAFDSSVVRRMPLRPSSAAAIGTEVHRRIEERLRGPDRSFVNVQTEDSTSGPALAAGPVHAVELRRSSAKEGQHEPGAAAVDIGDGSPTIEAAHAAFPGRADDLPTEARPDQRRVQSLVDSYARTAWATRTPARVEAAFSMRESATVLRGRVDLVFTDDPGRTDIVDLKTGFVTEASATTQLGVYALVAVRQWGADPERLRTTALVLRGDGPAVEYSTMWSGEHLQDVAGHVRELVDRLEAGVVDGHPGPHCRRCDFAGFCPSADLDARRDR